MIGNTSKSNNDAVSKCEDIKNIKHFPFRKISDRTMHLAYYTIRNLNFNISIAKILQINTLYELFFSE